MNYYSIDRCRPCSGAASIFLDKLLYGNSYFLSDGVLAYVVKGPLRIFNFKYEPDIYTQEISQQICVYMKYLFTLLMACLSLSTTYGTVHHPSSSVSSGRWVVWAEKPATSWQDAFVTGNGRHGTMVMGQPGSERIICVHEELFIRGWDRHKVAVPSTASLLPEVRRLIESGRSDAADELMTGEADRQLVAMGAVQRWPLIPHPAFDLCIRYTDTTLQAENGYRRQLDLETGETSAFWGGRGGVTESVFSSREHNVNVLRLKATGQRKINLVLGLKETPGREGVHFEHNLDSAFSSVSTEAFSGWLSYRAAYKYDAGGYEGLARVSLKGGSMITEGDSLRIADADEVLVLVRITPLENANLSVRPSVQGELSRLPLDYNTLLLPHSRKHAEMFRRMQLDLGCSSDWKTTSTEKMLSDIHKHGVTPLFLEQIHAMGRYLLISSSGKYPPPLQGIWGGGWKPGWIGGFVWDSNINLAVSAASMGNLHECAESYIGYVESLLPGWRLNARNYLGCRGFIVAHYNDPESGYLTHFGRSFPWMCWPGGAGWNIRPFYEYAMLTGNEAFLQKHVFPLYREMADFYEDYLTMDGDSLYHICPSVSPENAPPGTDTWLSKDATMDVAIAKEVFRLLLEMGRTFRADKKELAKWNNYLQRLPSYQINDEGALGEWIDEAYQDVYNHRHLSHLYPVFPGSQLGKSEGDPRLIHAARIALNKRFAFDTGSAHGLIHVALQAVRLGDIDKVKTNLDRFSRRHYLYDGLVTSHDPEHQVYNLDAVLSIPRLLMEMLVYTEKGKIELLPAWPCDYADGSIKGIKIYGGHTLDITWKAGKLIEAVLYARQNERYEVVCGDVRRHVQLHKGKTYHFPASFFAEK